MTETRLRRRIAPLAALLALAALLSIFSSSAAAAPTIEASGSIADWSPDEGTVLTGEAQGFKNTSASTPHAVGFDSPPGTPSCSGVPSAGQTSWEGSCTFSVAGEYAFHCTVHPGMMGKITVNSSGPGAPTATTENATSITETGATLKGSVNPNGQTTEYFFKYGTTMSYGQTTAKAVAGSGTGSVPVSAPITGLAPGTTYHFQLVAENASDTVPGSNKSFATLTPPGPPVAITSAATAVSDVGATLQGSVNPGGQQTSYFFEYGTSTSYDKKTSTKSLAAGTSPVGVSAIVSGLSPETTYHFRLVAKNGTGEDPGDDLTFKTTATPLPPPPEEEKPVTPPVLTPVTPIVTPPPPAETAPDTKLTSKPKAKSKDKTPTFKFTATVPGATFECQLDGKAFKACRSPLTTKSLKPGRHSFKVRAVGPTGVKDPSPAASSFKVVKPKPKR